MLGMFAEFETNLRRERQLEGIANAKAADVYKGRPTSKDVAQVRELKGEVLPWHLRDREGPQDRPCVRLSCIRVDPVAGHTYSAPCARCSHLLGRTSALTTPATVASLPRTTFRQRHSQVWCCSLEFGGIWASLQFLER